MNAFIFLPRRQGNVNICGNIRLRKLEGELISADSGSDVARDTRCHTDTLFKARACCYCGGFASASLRFEEEDDAKLHILSTHQQTLKPPVYSAICQADSRKEILSKRRKVKRCRIKTPSTFVKITVEDFHITLIHNSNID